MSFGKRIRSCCQHRRACCGRPRNVIAGSDSMFILFRFRPRVRLRVRDGKHLSCGVHTEGPSGHDPICPVRRNISPHPVVMCVVTLGGRPYGYGTVARERIDALGFLGPAHCAEPAPVAHGVQLIGACAHCANTQRARRSGIVRKRHIRTTSNRRRRMHDVAHFGLANDRQGLTHCATRDAVT